MSFTADKDEANVDPEYFMLCMNIFKCLDGFIVHQLIK
jgi:hypothetical protein